MIKQVFEFNALALGLLPRSVNNGLSPNQVSFLRKALTEEGDELLLASIGVDDNGTTLSSQESIVGQVDALIDAAYFAIGGLARLGLTTEQALACFDAVHEANMQKKLGTTHRGNTGVADAAKPAGWVGPEEAMMEILFPNKETP